jgi:tetratricopeptide (TPR) repeat protein
VKSGDPINLLIGISGTGPMELVQAPPLAELPKLAADFKVPSEPLAGFVKGERKIFQTTIRPRKPGITQIPSIPFSYFDPATGKFATIRSEPVSINVDPAEMLALDSVVNGRQTKSAIPNVNHPATMTAESIVLANFTGENVLAPQAPWTLNFAALISLLIAPPLVVAVIVLVRARTVWGNITSRFGSAAGRLERALTQAKDSAEIAGLINRFIAKQCTLNGTDVSAETVVGAMRVSGRCNLAIRCERLLNMCANDGGALPIGHEYNLDRLKGEAKQWLQDWQTENLRPRAKPNAGNFKRDKSTGTTSRRSSPIMIVAAFAMAGSLLYAGQSASAQAVGTFDDKPSMEVARVGLSTLQQQTLLAEANECYNAALEKVQSDSAEAKQGFADAADKYQLLVSSGVANSRLYFNLANAYLESGQTGRAIANYLRCLQIEPTLHEAQLNLAYAKKMLHAPAGLPDMKGRESSFGAYASVANEWLNNRISSRAVFVTMIGAWIAVWILIGMRFVGFYFPWKSALSAAMFVFILAAASSWLSWQTAEHTMAVVVQAPVAAGANVDVATAKVSQGQIVEPLQKRAGSVRVRTANGETIWLPDDSVEVI